MWVKLDRIHKLPAIIYKEGGNVNNFYFLVGFGNRLLVNVADSNKNFTIQAVSDFPLEVDRVYLVALEFSDASRLGLFSMYIDGKIQSVTDGNPVPTNTGMSTHSGDIGWGFPDLVLDTGGTDITYNALIGTKINFFGTYSNVGGGAPVSQSLKEELFTRGALASFVVNSDTVENMQIQLDTIQNTIRPNQACNIEVREVLGGGDFELIARSISFNPFSSINVRYSGSNTLTWVNEGSSSVDSDKIITLNGGVVSVVETSSFEFRVIDKSGNIFSNYEWRIYEIPTIGTLQNSVELTGEESTLNTTNIYSYRHTVDFNVAVQIISQPNNDYIEKTEYFTLTADDRAVDILIDIDTNN